MLNELGLGTRQPMVTLPRPCAHHPNQDIPRESLDRSPRWPSGSLPTISGTPPKPPAPGIWLLLPLAGMGAPGHSGAAQSYRGPRNLSKWGENAHALWRTRTRARTGTTNLPPASRPRSQPCWRANASLPTWDRCPPLPGASLS